MTEKAVEILAATHDGDDLAPGHLGLVQAALNGRLTQAGLQDFLDLHLQVKAGAYQRPWLCGVEHLTQDPAGFVYWRHVRVEHYSFMDPAHAIATVQELGRRCRYIESLGLEVRPSRVTTLWDWWKEIGRQTPYFSLFQRMTGDIYESSRFQCLYVGIRASIDPEGPLDTSEDFFSFSRVAFGLVLPKESPPLIGHERVRGRLPETAYHVLKGRGYFLVDLGQRVHAGTCFASLARVTEKFRQYRIPENLCTAF